MTDFLKLAVPGVQKLAPYQPGKPIEELEREYGVHNAAKLASNENPLGPSPQAISAMASSAKDVWLYPDGNGFELKQKLSSKLGVSPDMITLGNGSSDILQFIMQVFVTSDSEVIFSQHSFAIYPILTQMMGATSVVPAAKEWGYDLEAILAAITDKTRIIFIANPNNPTGTWLTEAEIASFLARVPEQVIVVLDEAYFEYAIDPATEASGYPDGLQWLEKYPNLLISRTFSKVYGLAGVRVGYGISHPQLTNLMNRVRPPFNVNSIALVGAAASLDDEEHLARSVATNAAGLKQLMRGFDEMGLGYIPSAANFISVDVGREAAPIYDALLYEGIIVRPVANYQMPNHLRVTVGTEIQNSAILTALKKVLA
ncbi:MAG: histidinol-phosphate transaminase [Gammaproteobacteria bacterium]|nr:histidinol-phosphate transaminase [Gammaproteobacteria bacterium]